MSLIGFDLDDVLVDCVPRFLEWYNLMHSASFKYEDITDHGLYKIWGIEKKEMIDLLCRFLSTDFAMGMDLVDGAKKGVDDLLSKGNEGFITTARPIDFKEPTIRLVNRDFRGKFLRGPYFSDDFIGDGRMKKKSEILIELGADYLIDDSLEYCVDCAQAGIKVILFDRPWNRKEYGKLEDLGISRGLGWYGKNGYPGVIDLIE
ncbi:MAG: hypothetical protein ABIE22_04575 [archaeon]